MKRLATALLLGSLLLASAPAWAAAATVSYTYDNLGRLTGVTITSASGTRIYTFTYDPAGNRVTHQIQ